MLHPGYTEPGLQFHGPGIGQGIRARVGVWHRTLEHVAFAVTVRRPERLPTGFGQRRHIRAWATLPELWPTTAFGGLLLSGGWRCSSPWP